MTDETKPWVAEMPVVLNLDLEDLGMARVCMALDVESALTKQHAELAKVRAERDAALTREMGMTELCAALNADRYKLQDELRLATEAAEALKVHMGVADVRIAELESFAVGCRDDWYCDDNAFAKHDAECRRCQAEKLKPSIKQKETT